MDVDGFIERLLHKEWLNESELHAVCAAVKEVLLDEPNVARVAPPVTLVGDLLGQFGDLLEVFLVSGPCPHTNYVFLGNYVGFSGVQTVLLLLCLKVRYPSRLTLLRGTHEARDTTKVYGFYDECLEVYGCCEHVWELFCEVFDHLPLAALVEDPESKKRIFAVHGGFSSKLTKIDEILVIERFKDVPRALEARGPDEVFVDLLWSEPAGHYPGFFLDRKQRGATFGQEAVMRFKSDNDLDLLVRGNQVCVTGSQFLFKGSLCTLWSAPNPQCGVVGAVLQVWAENGDLHKRILTFSSSPEKHERPYHKRNQGVPGYLTLV
eukprot:TRINITY_DN4776_c0_g1_i1.p1 TRINITY_DN4776_c0_g1~~TRINITY_DN4776_c0_g1_i1.p1  ORF type:complete len:321 (+),score=75.69 TRINITY_DN4776_c0_g1_i1:2-964(+)